MTSPSSYLFYENTDSPHDPKIGTRFVRVSVTDGMIQAEHLEIIHISASGKATEEVLEKEIYSIHKNSRGIKYLKFQLLENGALIDRSPENIQSLSPFPHSVVVHVSQDCRELVEKLILDWFNIPYRKGHFAYIKRTLYFPAWHDGLLSSFIKEESNSRLKTLCQLQSKGFDLLNPLREADSWDSFAKQAFPHTVKTKADGDTLAVYSFRILPLAITNLGRTLSSFSAEEMRVLLTREDYFSPADSQIIDFMLNQSNPTERNEIISLLMDILRMQDAKVKIGIDGFSTVADIAVGSSAIRKSPYKVSIDRIPSSLSAEVIQQLKNCLVEIHAKITEKPFEGTDYLTLKTELTAILREWYAAKVLAPQLDQSKVTFEMLENQFQALFDSSLTNKNTCCMRSYYTGHTGSINEVCSIPALCIHLAMSDTSLHDDVLTRLFKIVPVSDHPKDRGLYSGDSAANGFIHKTGVFIPVSGGGLYLLDDILDFLERGAAVIDEHLKVLGREITAANRAKFLMMSEERQFKESWDIQEWGATSYSKTRILREKGIFTKEAIQMYTSLPDDMFYDFLELESNTPTSA